MAERDQQERRSSIRHIMADESLTPLEKRRSIQHLMDGRRRSSIGTAASSMSSSGDTGTLNTSIHTTSDTDDEQRMSDLGSTEASVVIHPSEQQQQQQQEEVVVTEVVEFHSDEPNHRRQRRSASLPGWSDAGMPVAAPAVAAVSSNAIWDDPINISRRMEKSRPPCSHYERNCTIISPCCGVAFGCRICHDECPVLPMPKNKTRDNFGHESMAASVNWIEAFEGPKLKHEKRRSLPLAGYEEEEETHHEIDRFTINEIICRLCYTRQSSKSNYCITCQTQFAAYHCSICNLWMSNDEIPYHCEDCGFCRVGGRENFRHCHDCGMCIDTLLFEDHNCRAGNYMSNCPVCQEDLFSSRDASHEMPCGHAIHWHCFKELTSYDTRCPVCKKTAETPEQMAPTWQAMAMGIALQPVPPELARVVTIICNDCEARDENRRWHFLGVRCLSCMSFNTSVERTSMTGHEAAAYLDELDEIQGIDSSLPTGSNPSDGG